VIDRAGLVRAMRLAFLLLVVAWLVWALASNPGNLEGLALVWKQPSAWLFLFGWMTIPAGLWILWRSQILLSTGYKLPWSTALSIQAVAWGGRYLPGKTGLWVAKTALTRRSGLGWRALGVSVLTEQLLFLIAGALIVLALVLSPESALLAQLPDSFTSSFQTILGQPMIILVAVLAVVLAAMAGISIFLARLASDAVRAIGWQHWPLLLSGHIVIHLVAGLSLYPLVALMLPQSADTLGPLGVAGALALANIAGIAAVFAPAGLGVREAVLAAVLAVSVDYDQALSVAVVLRVITLFADALFAVGGWITGKTFEP
jgi:glycosyltransferase 2 family protein